MSVRSKWQRGPAPIAFNHLVVRLEIWAVVTLFLGPISGEMAGMAALGTHQRLVDGAADE